MSSAIMRGEDGSIKRVRLDNTQFIWTRNLQGDPNRDTYRSPARYVNIIIPDIQIAQELINEGFNVKLKLPREGEEEGSDTAYFIKANLKYKYENGVLLPFTDRRQPKVYLVSGDNEPILCGPDGEGDFPGVSIIDTARIDNVKATLNVYQRDENSQKTLYIQHLYAHQSLTALDEDPFYYDYRKKEESEEEDLLPF